MGIAPRLESGEKLQEVLREKFNRMAEEVEALGKLESDSGLIAIDDMGSGKVIRWTGPRYFDTGGGAAAEGYSGAFAVRTEAVTDSNGSTTRWKATVYDSSNASSNYAGTLHVRFPGTVGSLDARAAVGIVSDSDEWIPAGSSSSSSNDDSFEDVAGKSVYLLARVYRDFAEGAWRMETRFAAALSTTELETYDADEMTYWKRLATVDTEGNVTQKHLCGDVTWRIEGAFNAFRVACHDGTVAVFDAGDPDSGVAGLIAIGSTSYDVSAWESADALGKDIYATVRAADDDESGVEGQTSDGNYVIAIEAAANSSDLSIYRNSASWSRRLATVDSNGHVQQIHPGGDLEIPTARWT